MSVADLRGLLVTLLSTSVAGTPRPAAPVGPDEVERKLRLDYLYSQKDVSQKALDGAEALFDYLYKPEIDLDAFMNDLLSLMKRRFWIREATIALLDRKENLFRYKYQTGLRREAWEAHRVLSYKPHEHAMPGVYKAREISKHTSMFLAEDNPYGEGEDGTFSRPLMLRSRRFSVEDSVEGDYFDVWMFGKDREVVGWIEFSGTTAGKLPDVVTIKWVEMLSSIASLALMLSELKGPRLTRVAP